MNKSVKNTLVLVCICAAISVLLAVTNAVTAPIIEKNQNAAANEALLEVMPNGSGFEKVDISSFELPATVTEAYKESSGGYVFKLTTTGYSSGFVIMCGVNADGTVSGALCLSSTETLGYEKTFGENFAGKNADEVAAVDTISGATKTTGAYRSAVNDALNAAIILGGGSVDIRTEEEILADNLSAALPEGEGAFTKLFIVEEITGIDAIYSADNGAGYVCVVGEEFIAVDATGKSADPDVESQMAIILATETEDVDLSQYEGIASAVLGAEKTATGNYIFDLRGAGYGINGGDDYHPASGEYIYIKLSMTSDGKIIDCLTVSQAETSGIGDACADDDFYGQFVGKTEADYTEIDAISGATLTTNGYKKAIERAFAALNIIEGGASNE